MLTTQDYAPPSWALHLKAPEKRVVLGRLPTPVRLICKLSHVLNICCISPLAFNLYCLSHRRLFDTSLIHQPPAP